MVEGEAINVCLADICLHLVSSGLAPGPSKRADLQPLLQKDKNSTTECLHSWNSVLTSHGSTNQALAESRFYFSWPGHLQFPKMFFKNTEATFSMNL